jgi:signal transduction histidine kinase
LLVKGNPRCDDRIMVGRSLAVAGTAALVVACLTQVRERPDLAPGGDAAGAIALQCAAAFGLVAGAVRAAWPLACALLLAAAGLALHALPEPHGGALLFTLALVGAAVAPAAAAHAALLYPDERLVPRLDRAAVALGYATHFLLGVAVALVFDPAAAGCFACPDNLLLVRSDPSAADWLGRFAPRAAAATEVSLALLVAVRLARRAPAARSIAAPVAAGAMAALVLSAVGNLRAADGLASTGTDRDVWLATAAALGVVGIGLAWRPIRAARVRAALGRLTVATSGGPEELRAALARACGDPTLTIVVPHPESGDPLTLDGHPAPPERARTAVERRGRLVAWLDHDPDVPAIPEIARPAALTLEREALLASQRLQEEEVRASTARLVEAGDAERRRLERDLHDGAQQRLLALGIAVERAPAAEAARTRLREMRENLRRIAHGIHSVPLAEGGLAEAVLALVDAAGATVTVEALPDRRASAAAEAALYRFVAAGLRLGRDTRLAIEASDGALTATLQVVDADLSEALAHAGARIAAVRGELTIEGDTARGRVPISG